MICPKCAGEGVLVHGLPGDRTIWPCDACADEFTFSHTCRGTGKVQPLPDLPDLPDLDGARG